MDAPSEFKRFHELFTGLSLKYDPAMVFDDFLEYIILYHNMDKGLKWDKRYSKAEIKTFWLMYCEWLKVMDQKLVDDKAWFDFFGVYYEAEVISKLGKQGSGQFFTPDHICDFMAEIMLDKAEEGWINDPTCGSGRCLVAAHMKAPGAFMFGQDLDRTCALMAVCNFLIHGVRGLVVWGDTLTGEVRAAWKVNEALDIVGLPLVRRISEGELGLLLEVHGESPVESTVDVHEAGPVTLDQFMKVEGK